MTAIKAKSKQVKVSGLPPIPDRPYFSIADAALLCGVEKHVLRYWEQVFDVLRPTKRRGNRRSYQEHDIKLVRRIRYLLYEKGFTIEGARVELAKQSDQQAQGQHHYQQILKSTLAELESLLTLN